MPKSPKKSKYRHVLIKKKRYYFYKITWADITGDAGHATTEEFTKFKPSVMITQAYVFYKNKYNDKEEDLLDKVDLTKSYEVMKWLSGMYRKIFISDIILKERKNVANQKITTWSINKEYLYELRDLARFKDKNLPEGELDFTIGMEWKIKEEGLNRQNFSIY